MVQQHLHNLECAPRLFIRAVVFVFVLLTLADGVASGQAASPEAWYPFDGNANDASGNGHDGVANGAPVVVAGKIGQAYQFNGTSDYISVAWADPVQGGDQSFTIAAWVKTTDTTGDHWVVASDSPWQTFLFGLSGGTLKVYWRYGPSYLAYGLDSQKPIAGDFAHIAVSYDATTKAVRLYINGQQVASDLTTQPPGPSNFSNLYIGAALLGSPLSTVGFNGVIDDVRVYGSALALADIRALAGLPPMLARADPADGTVYVSWFVYDDLPAQTTWEIDYAGPAGTTPSPITGLAGSARGYTLSGLTNGSTYTITLQAMNNGVPLAQHTQVLTATPSIASVHPRLFVSPQDLLRLQNEAQSTSVDSFNLIRAQAETLLSSAPPAEPTGAVDITIYYNAADNLTLLAFAYLVTGDDQFYTKAHEYLMAYAGWTYWGDGNGLGQRDLGLAAMLRANAMAYDWLYTRLPASDQTTIRTALAAHTQEQYEAATSPWEADWDNWWTKSYVQNHWTTCNSSIGFAALALESEDSRVDAWLTQAEQDIQRDHDILENIVDGTWHEGIQYQTAKLEAELGFWSNLKRLKGVDLIPHTYLNRFVTWMCYNRLPGLVTYSYTYPGCLMPFADYQHDYGGWNSSGGTTVLQFIASEEQSPAAQWLAQQIRNDTNLIAYTHYTPTVLEYLFFDNSVAATTPNLPLTQTFSDLEGVIWRTGWGSGDLVFGFKTGAAGGRFIHTQYLNHQMPFEDYDPNGQVSLNAGHDHLDANTFYLFRGNVDLASEMPDINSHETAAHNTLLVDGQGQFMPSGPTPNTDGKLQAVYTTADFNYLVGDATNLYAADETSAKWLNEFTRRVLFVRPGYFVMVDNLRANTAHLYDWVSYFAETKPAPVTVEGNWVKAPASSTDVLGINVLAPAGFTYDLGAGVHPYTNGTQTKPYIHLHPAANVANTRFVTVLYPTTNADWANKPAMALLDNTDQGVGVRVTSNGTQDHLFNYSGAAQAGIGEYALTGEVASVSKDASGNPSQIFIGNGTQLSDGNGARILFQAPAAVTAEAVISGTSLALNGASLNGLRIYAPQTDAAQVTVNGIAVAAVKSGDTIILPGGPVPVSVLPPGRGVWWIVGIVMGLAAWLPLVRGMRKNRSRLL